MSEEEYEALLAKLDEDITSLTDEELTQLRDKITEHGRELKTQAAENPPSGDELEQLTKDADHLADALTRIAVEAEAREAAVAESAAKVDEAFKPFDEPEPEPVAEPEPEPVASVAAVARRRPLKAPAPEPVKPKVVVAAAVGEEGLGGAYDSPADVARAMWDAKRRGPNGSVTVARIPVDHGRELGRDEMTNWSLLTDLSRKTQEFRIMNPGLPLTAGGFCAEAEPVYEYFEAGSLDGILDVPATTAKRGRVTYPEIFNIRDVMVQSGVGWQTTSTMDHDGIEKPCYTIACGDGVTYDVDAYSTCLKMSNFDQQFWPERVTHVTGQAMIAHAHAVNLALLGLIAADARTATVVDGHTNGGTWVQFANSLVQHSSYIRSHYRLPLATVLEAAVPSFVRDALISDHVARAATTDYDKTAAMIDATIRSWGINPQWVYDWQELGSPNWPAQYNYLLFPAGVVQRLDGGTIDLGVTRDSTLNVANDACHWRGVVPDRCSRCTRDNLLRGRLVETASFVETVWRGRGFPIAPPPPTACHTAGGLVACRLCFAASPT